MVKSIISKYKNVPVEVKASIYYTICSIVQKCIVLITLPIFTRLMTTQQYGQYSIYQSWMNIVAIFATLNLQYGSFDTAMIKFENDRGTLGSGLEQSPAEPPPAGLRVVPWLRGSAAAESSHDREWPDRPLHPRP